MFDYLTRYEGTFVKGSVSPYFLFITRDIFSRNEIISIALTGILSVWNTKSEIAATHAGSIIIAGAAANGGNDDTRPAG